MTTIDADTPTSPVTVEELVELARLCVTAAEAVAASAARNAKIVSLHARGVPVKDLVPLTGLSHQRLYKILDGRRGGNPGTPIPGGPDDSDRGNHQE